MRLKWIRRLLLLVLLLLLVILIALTYLSTSKHGLKQLTQIVDHLLPGKLNIEQLSGSLWSQLDYKKLTYVDTSINLSLHDFHFKWLPNQLWRKKLHIETLTLDSITLHSMTPQNTPQTTKKSPLKLADIHLPFDITLNHMQVNKVIVAGVTYKIQQIKGKMSWQKDKFSLQKLALRIEDTKIALNGEIRPQQKYPMDFTLAWSTRFNNIPLNGQGKLIGTLDKVEFSHQLKGIGNISSDLKLRNLLTTLDWQLNMSMENIKPKDFAKIPLELVLNAQIKAAGDLQNITLEQLIINRPQSTSQLILEGQIKIGDTPYADLIVRWKDLGWPLDNAIYVSNKGSITLKGSHKNYQINTHADISVKNFPSAVIQLKAHGNDKQMDIQSLLINTLEGQIKTIGNLAWKPEIQWSLHSEAKHLTLQALHPELPSPLNAKIISHGKIIAGNPDISLHIINLDAKKATHHLQAQGKIKIRNKRIDINNFKLNVANAQISINGKYGPQTNLQWHIKIPDIAKILPESHGAINFNGKATGSPLALLLKTKLNARNLIYQQHEIAHLNANLHIDSSDKTPSYLKIQIKDLKSAGQLIKNISINGAGLFTDHQLSLHLQKQNEHLKLKLKGGLTENNTMWQGELESIQLSQQQLGSWYSLNAAKLLLSAKKSELKPLCLQQLSAKICITASQIHNQQKVNMILHHYPLSLFAKKVDGLNLSGTLNGEVNVHKNKDKLTAELNILPLSGTLNWQIDDTRKIKIHYPHFSHHTLLNEQGLLSQTRLKLSEGGFLNARLKTPYPSGEWNKLPLHGEITAKFQQFGLISAISPQLEEVNGQVNTDLFIRGTLENPEIQGNIKFSQGQIDIPVLGVRLKEITVTVKALADKKLALKGSIKSGQGQLNLSGSVNIAAQSGFPVSMTLSGKNWEVINLAEYGLRITPKIQINYKKEKLSIIGNVEIPYAKINPRTLPEGVEITSADEIIIGQTQTKDNKKSAFDLHAEIKIKLGDDVKINAFGLNTRMIGLLQVYQAPKEALALSGEIKVASQPVGRFRAYGQDLTIRRGRIYFSGIADKPGIDVEAIRTSGNIIAGVRALGNVSQPKIEIFSEPNMDQTDVLSYLITGHSFSSANDAESDLMSSAVSSMGNAAAGILGSRLGNKVGLDSVEVEGDSQNAKVMLGKYLTPDLFVSYGSGLFDASQILKIRYALSKKLSLQAESSSEQSGADLFYVIEIK